MRFRGPVLIQKSELLIYPWILFMFDLLQVRMSVIFEFRIKNWIRLWMSNLKLPYVWVTLPQVMQIIIYTLPRHRRRLAATLCVILSYKNHWHWHSAMPAEAALITLQAEQGGWSALRKFLISYLTLHYVPQKWQGAQKRWNFGLLSTYPLSCHFSTTFFYWDPHETHVIKNACNEIRKVHDT